MQACLFKSLCMFSILVLIPDKFTDHQAQFWLELRLFDPPWYKWDGNIYFMMGLKVRAMMNLIDGY